MHMEDRSVKTVAQSRTEQIQILMPEHINGYQRLFGGKLMEWIDVVAGVVARRHSNSEVTTASVDNLQFKSCQQYHCSKSAAYLCGDNLNGGTGGYLCGVFKRQSGND